VEYSERTHFASFRMSVVSRLAAQNGGIFGVFLTLNTTNHAIVILSHWLEKFGASSDTAEGLRQLAAALGSTSLRVLMPGGMFGDLENFLEGSWVGGWKDPMIEKIMRFQSAVSCVCCVCVCFVWTCC
jgi:hypothetical protein